MKNLKCLFFLFSITFSLSGKAQEVLPENRTIIRVLSYNILHGATTNRDNDLDVVAGVINKIEPDLVALQEMDYKTNRADKIDITTAIAQKTEMVSIFAKAMDYNGGEYGQALLSKHTFLKTGKIDLPHEFGNEPRIAVDALIVLPSGDTIKLAGTHLDHLKESPDRIKQVKKLNEVLLDNKYPTILAGDLNDVPGSKAIELLESHWGSSYDEKDPQPTFPSQAPEVKIDYVMFYPKNRWKVIGTETICDEIASDHCAYLVVLELLPENGTN